MVAVTRLFVVVMREEVGLIMDGFTMVAVDTGWTKSAASEIVGKLRHGKGDKQRTRLQLKNPRGCRFVAASWGNRDAGPSEDDEQGELAGDSSFTVWRMSWLVSGGRVLHGRQVRGR